MSTETELIEMMERAYGRFIHMGPQDKAIWARFLLSGGTKLGPFEYDVRVGDGVPMPASSSQMELKLALALTTKRIDALGWSTGKRIIFEVKPRAGLSAIGQLIGYRELYHAQFPDESIPFAHLVTDQLQPDMIRPLDANEIGFTEVGY
jgi:hypothetical protein